MGQQPTFEEETNAFLKFLEDKKIIISEKVAVADLRSQNQGRGMVALEDIDEGETLFTIPSSALLQSGSDSELQALVEKYELDIWGALIVKMMACHADAEWAPYFAVLPKTFNTPMFWTPEETNSLLAGSEIIEKIDREGADAVFSEMKDGILKEKYFEGKDCSIDTFHRMGSLIMAYAFDVPSADSHSQGNEGDNDSSDEEEDEFEGKAMIPLADTLNSHTKLHNARLTIPETPDEPWEMVASKPIPKGSQVYNNYGDLASCDMLRRYGFVEAGGTDFEVVELSGETVEASICDKLKLKRDDVRALIDSRVEKYTEVPESFVISATPSEDSGELEVEVDFELLLLLNCVASKAAKFNRKEFARLAKLSQNEELIDEAEELLRAVLSDRKRMYKQPLPTPSEAGETRVYVEKKDMAAQVLQSENMILEMAERAYA